MRVLVCGGRQYGDYEKVKAELDACASICATLRTTLVVIEGGANGADALAARWCRENPANVDHRQVKAEWEDLDVPGAVIRTRPDGKKYNAAAGGVRNQRMLLHGPGLVLAFPGGKGTADMIRRAEAAGIQVRRIE